MKPAALRSLSTSIRSSTSFIITVSVISILSFFGAMPNSLTRAFISEATSMMKKSLGEIFTEINLSMPRFSQSESISQAQRHIYLSTSTIIPFFSKTGMNFPGGIKPSTGFIHLTRASAPTAFPEISTIGCRYGVSCLSFIASLSWAEMCCSQSSFWRISSL